MKVAEVKGSGDQQGAKPDDDAIKTALAALKKIKEVAEKQGINLAEASSAKVGSDNKEGAKILATESDDKGLEAADASKALAILTKVTGEETLAAVLASKDNDAELSSDATAGTTAVSFALGGTENNVKEAEAAKAGAATGGIALRSLLKSGKLAHKNGTGDNTAVTEELSRAFEGGSESVAEVGSGAQQGAKPDDGAIKAAVAALNKIKEVAEKQGIKLATESGATVETDKEGAKILATESNKGLEAGDASKALAILTKVTGEETLAAV
ncbi:hypothetical protein F0310_05635, partial (plasmid) [Borrelia sp. A-FGy1]|uniref:variable large family protein n=1 Tax=Borrelia sp. A-FGy1 TaxID=2608247 RepID=UPI0015F5E0F9